MQHDTKQTNYTPNNPHPPSSTHALSDQNINHHNTQTRSCHTPDTRLNHAHTNTTTIQILSKRNTTPRQTHRACDGDTRRTQHEETRHDDTTPCTQREKNADARERNAHDTRAAAYRLHKPTPRQPPKTRREETRGEAPTGADGRTSDERMRTRAAMTTHT